MARNFNELRDKINPERRARNEQRVKEAIAALPTDHLREARELTQTQLARILEVPPDAVSDLERRTDIYLSTLRSYVRAMGGDLHIRVILPEGEVIINQFSDLDEAASHEPAQREETVLSGINA